MHRPYARFFAHCWWHWPYARGLRNVGTVSFLRKAADWALPLLYIIYVLINIMYIEKTQNRTTNISTFQGFRRCIIPILKTIEKHKNLINQKNPKT